MLNHADDIVAIMSMQLARTLLELTCMCYKFDIPINAINVVRVVAVG